MHQTWEDFVSHKKTSESYVAPNNTADDLKKAFVVLKRKNASSFVQSVIELDSIVNKIKKFDENVPTSLQLRKKTPSFTRLSSAKTQKEINNAQKVKPF